MKIAEIVSVSQSIPPEKYGGAEQIVFDLTEELVRRGHEVTLFATGDSKTSAKLVSRFQSPVTKLPFYNSAETFIYWSLNASEAFERAAEFDVIHNHVGECGLIFSGLVKTPVLTTHHGMFTEAVKLVYKKYAKKAYFIALSEAQKTWLPEIDFIKTVYSGVDIEKFEFNPEPKDYLLFLSKIWPSKGPHLAIEAAKKAKKKLIIAGNVSKKWQDYFEKEIKPQVDGKNIIYFGEADFKQKVELYKNAIALLFPINWQDALPLVPMEAMACGTPVIAFDCASVPEMVIDNKTGFLVKDVERMVEAIKKISKIKRADCRKHVEEKFTVKRMTDDYEDIYKSIIK